jgi:hypothetical protein
MRNDAWRWSSPRDGGGGDSMDTGEVRQSPVVGHRQKVAADVGVPLGRCGAEQGGHVQGGFEGAPVASCAGSEGKWGGEQGPMWRAKESRGWAG